MTQSGDPLDNAVAERANGILKTEWLYRTTIPTHKACKRELKRIISFYNDERAHMSIGNRKRVRDAASFLIIMLVTFAATLLKPQKYVSSRTIQKCVEHVSTST